MQPEYSIVNADCLELLGRLPADRVDAFVQDPPYGLAFMGNGWDHAVPGPEYFAAQLRVAKPGAHLVAFGGTRTYHRLTCAIEDAGWELRDCLMWLYGTGFPKSHNGAHGGTALKPSWEPIILARKPFKTTVAKNYAAHGTGALNIDGCRIGYASDADKASAVPQGKYPSAHAGFEGKAFAIADRSHRDPKAEQSALGRWPANVVLDPEAGAILDAQTGTLKSGGTLSPENNLKATTGWAGGSQADRVKRTFERDAGGPSRFFYCAKASKSEREAGLEDFTPQIVNDGRTTSIDNAYQRGDTKRRNTHPTVKPLALMRWLVRLVTPPGGLVCDPFCGSGSTGCAAVAEGFNFLGIDREPDFVRLADARVAHWVVDND